jgi:hypothetical protein
MHGLYSVNLERFILLDDDRWTLLHAAKLLSSKMQLSVCQFDDGTLITKDDCLNWTTDASVPQDQQVAKLCYIENSLKRVGPPVDINYDLLQTHLSYVKFVLKMVKVSWETEAIRGIGDQTYFLGLVGEKHLVKFKDETWAEDGFLFTVDKILYLSKNKEEAMLKINKIFNNPDTAMPTVLSGYKSTFFGILKNYD